MKTIIILLLAALSFSAYAQSKPDTTKKPVAPAKVAPVKPQYQADPNKVYHITLDLTGDQVLALTGAAEGILHRSAQLKGDQIGELEDEAKSISKAIKSQANAQATSDYKKWQADTAKAVKPRK